MNRLAHAILELLGDEKPPRALHVNEIASRLGVGDRRALSGALDQLVSDGVVRLRSGQRYAAVEREASNAPREVEGFLHVNPKGFGFLRVGGGVDDVFIPAEAIGGAMHGDRVKARLAPASRRGLEGSVLEVLARGRRRVVGVVRGRAGHFRLEPDDLRLRGPIAIASDTEARGTDAIAIRPGGAAVVEIVRYPRFPDELPTGRLVAALGAPGDPDVEVQKILLEHEIDEEQSPAAVAEARAFGDRCDPVEMNRRVDLRHLKLVTIDPKTARDHDDAVWVERDGDGFRAWIAIADVSSYVRPGSALDASSLARGNSVYLPDRSIPMLPHELSSGLCSLLPRQERLCMCVEVLCDDAGHPISTKIYEAAMRSHAFLTYDSVARALGFSTTAERDPEAEAMRSDLQVMWELSSRLRKRRMRRGALDLELPESDIVLDDVTRAPTEISQRAEDPGIRKAYRLIEELMLLANESVARYMLERQVPSIYRIHGAPDAEKLGRFATLCGELGLAFAPEVAEDPRELSRFMHTISEHPKKSTLHMLLLRAMQQARYDTTNIGHFGLASSAYLHFTSPIRRYSDLVVHRILRQSLRGERIVPSEKLMADLDTAALAASERERLTMESERSIHDLYRALYMRSRIGETFKGTVVALTGSGVYVQLADPFVTVLVLFDDLGGGGYELDDTGLRVVGRSSGDVVGLGDDIEVTVFDASITRRTVYARREGGSRRSGEDARRGGRKTRTRGRTAPEREAPKSRRSGPKSRNGVPKSRRQTSGGRSEEPRSRGAQSPAPATGGGKAAKPKLSSSHGSPFGKGRRGKRSKRR